MTNATRLWILGAADHEMAAIETLLREAGEEFVCAINDDGSRVTPRTAYCRESQVATGEALLHWLDDRGLDADSCHGEDSQVQIYCVECAAPIIEDDCIECQLGHTSIDHHRPGDPGYERPPGEFLTASSIGQVVAALACIPGALQFFEFSEEPTAATVGEFALATDGVVIGAECDVSDDPAEVWALVVPRDTVIVAACDHCLGAAWGGQCPGVSRDDVREYRARMAAQRPHDQVSVDEYRSRFDAALAAIAAAPTMPVLECYCGACGNHGDRGLCDCGYCGGQYSNAVDLRGTHVAELPDAASYAGIAYLATVDGRGASKTVLGGATTPELVEAFMTQWGPSHGLREIYGSPQRGFAGGIV